MSVLLSVLLALETPQVDLAADPLVEEFLRRCEKDGKALWGRSLCAPIVIVDPATALHRTSLPAPEAPLPAMRANTALEWGGEDWIMVLEPLPNEPAKLSSLLFHEAWHVHQKALGFAPNNAVAAHLENATQRYLLRLEWAALARALSSSGPAARTHVSQALAFRQRRIGSNPEWAEAEREQMRHEGLAAYTGIALSGAAQRLALEELDTAGDRAALARTFAYVGGPAWGLLLDRYKSGWKREKQDKDLPDQMPIAASPSPRPDDYGATDILLDETLKDIRHQARLAAATAATAEARALRLPLAKMGMDFDPNRVLALPNGTAYEKITLRDSWGEIRLDGVPLRIDPEFSAAYVAWPAARDSLQLAPGWTIEENGRGDVRLVPPAD